ncbi:hypothetical protein ACFP1Z_00350 [Streptomyces gamaensis]|uniref:Uncharacterized protein n=1 Tax=Streptomyces gamaensis TaxID=1763542 RepID=A0ABW0YVC9_9ACTN
MSGDSNSWPPERLCRICVRLILARAVAVREGRTLQGIELHAQFTAHRKEAHG